MYIISGILRSRVRVFIFSSLLFFQPISFFFSGSHFLSAIWCSVCLVCRQRSRYRKHNLVITFERIRIFNNIFTGDNDSEKTKLEKSEKSEKSEKIEKLEKIEKIRKKSEKWQVKHALQIYGLIKQFIQ